MTIRSTLVFATLAFALPAAADTTIFSEDFESGDLAGWEYTYSTNGVPSGSACPGVWEASVNTDPITGDFSARLYATASNHCSPWTMAAAISRMIDIGDTTHLSVSLRFDEIQGSGGTGLSNLEIVLFDPEESFQSYSYGFATNVAGSWKNYRVAADGTYTFDLPFAEDFEELNGAPPSGEMMLRIRVRADYAEGGSGARSADVAVDDVRLYKKDQPCAADLDGDGQIGFGDLLTLLTAWGPCV